MLPNGSVDYVVLRNFGEDSLPKPQTGSNFGDPHMSGKIKT
jgi:hypothetical protein